VKIRFILHRFPHGSEVRFDCLPSIYEPEDEDEDDYYEESEENDEKDLDGGTTSKPPLFRSWKIKCVDGQWRGEALGCDSAGRPIDTDMEASTDNKYFE